MKKNIKTLFVICLIIFALVPSAQCQDTIRPAISVNVVTSVTNSDATVSDFLSSSTYAHLPTSLTTDLNLRGSIDLVTLNNSPLTMICFSYTGSGNSGKNLYVYTNLTNHTINYIVTQLVITSGVSSNHYEFYKDNGDLNWSIDVNSLNQISNLSVSNAIDFSTISPVKTNTFRAQSCNTLAFGACMVCHANHCSGWCEVLCYGSSPVGLCLGSWALSCLED